MTGEDLVRVTGAFVMLFAVGAFAVLLWFVVLAVVHFSVG